MVTRTALSPGDRGGLYFTSEKSHLDLVSSGCALLDCVLGGGWPLGRIVNVVGDKSSGKTLLAIEATANFLLHHPKGVARYVEAEAAFDVPYAQALGMPVSKVEFERQIDTAEGLFQDIQDTLDRISKPIRPCLYILDSLDALSDVEEKKRPIDKGDYGARKAKKLGELFRRQVKGIERSKMLFFVISQIRENIGVSFGEKYIRSGGKSLDFYASQVLWLREVEKIEREVRGVKRVTALQVHARCKKNKIGLPYRECEFPILFGYGVDDVLAGCEWLSSIEGFKFDSVGLPEKGWKTRLATLRNQGGDTYASLRKKVGETVRSCWNSIEHDFLPKARKY